METSTDAVVDGCIFQWKIENVFHWWWLENKERIESPVFIAKKLKKTKWTLWFSPIEDENKSSVGIGLQRDQDCDGPNAMEVSYQFTFLDKDGLILKEIKGLKKEFLKNESSGLTFKEGERIFVTDREKFLPEDTLNIQCIIWITDEKPNNFDKLFATTVVKLKRSNFEWKIDEIGKVKSDIKKFSDYLISCNIHLQKNLDMLCISLSDLNDSIRYMSCAISMIDSEERKENCEIQKYFGDDLRRVPLNLAFSLRSETWVEIKSPDFPNVVLSFYFEFVFLTVDLSECSENFLSLENGSFENKSQSTTVLNVDYENYKNITLNDVELFTISKTFKAHKKYLSASSPVFERKISRKLKENKVSIYIGDFEDDTVLQMLEYIYSNDLKNLGLDSANKLYKIAEKYEILSLKSKCHSFFIGKLEENACEILVLTDLHDGLKKDVQDYILRHHKKIFCSEEWKNLMKTHLKLAADILYKTLTTKSNF